MAAEYISVWSGTGCHAPLQLIINLTRNPALAETLRYISKRRTACQNSSQSHDPVSAKKVMDPVARVDSKMPSHTNGFHVPDAVKDNGKYDPTFTKRVIEAIGPKTSPRFREIMTSLIQHVHDFARETELTVDEWAAGVNLINWAGQMSTDRRNEGQLLCDVIGLESLVDEITYKKAAEADDVATQSAILGPFFRLGTPQMKMGSNISQDTPADAQPVYMFGRVVDAKTQKPVCDAEIDVWEASTNGLYEQQDPDQKEFNLRGKFKTGPDGEYSFYCIRPTPYPVPDDGPAGQVLQMLDRHPYRPAHIHLIVLREGYKPVTTQIFDAESKYLEDDSVFAVKDSLVVTFVPREGDPQAKLELNYDIALKPNA